MKRSLKAGLLAAFIIALSGCVYDPGYVRHDGYYGDAYGDAYYGAAYGRSPAMYYDAYDWPGYYYGYGYGPTFGFGLRYHDYRRGHYYHRPAYAHGHRH
jgi:hypothetical protein